MNVQPGSPVPSGSPDHPRPPHPRATAADTVFALSVAALGLLLAGALLAAGGGPPWPAWLGVGAGMAATPAVQATSTPGTTATPGAETPPPPDTSPGASPSSSAPASPSASEAASPAADPSPGASAAAFVSPGTTPSASPAAGPFAMNLYRRGVFVHEVDKESCVAAAVQNMLNVIRLTEDGRAPDTSEATQRALYRRIVELTTWEDSHNGGTGPGGWAAVLTEMGYPYEVRTYPSRVAALRAAASALRATGRPVGILAWAGVHSWVMTGFTATADPAVTTRFTVTTANVLDPWYPWISTRWPRSEAPAVPRNAKDLNANILPWNLASGPYEGRDGKFLLVEPFEG